MYVRNGGLYAYSSLCNALQVKTYIHPVTGCRAAYVPMGRFIHVPPPFPRSDWANNFGRPWWKDDQYYVGLLTAKTRQIRIVNMLTLQVQTVEVHCVCSIIYMYLRTYVRTHVCMCYVRMYCMLTSWLELRAGGP